LDEARSFARKHGYDGIRLDYSKDREED